jgi:biotin synthase
MQRRNNGMGESIEDRAGMLVALSTLNPQPESVPINALVAVEGTLWKRKTS